MGAPFNYGSIFWISFSLILISLFVISSAIEPKCKPSKNQKWNAKKQKCVDCPDCSPGYFRNLNEKYNRREGDHGAERCIQCRPCPSGTYSSSGYGECSKCRMNCTEFNRETAEPCTRLHDAKCGSCLNGYYDMYKNTLFPCAPNTQRAEPRLLLPRKKPENTPSDKDTEDNTVQEDKVTSLGQDTSIVEPKQDSFKGTTEQASVSYVSVAVFCGVGIAFILLSTGLLLKIRSNRVRRHGIQSTRLSAENGRYGLVPGRDLSRDNDIEMDTFVVHDQSDAALYNPSRDTHISMTSTGQDTHFTMTSARPELAISIQPPQQARAELSQPDPDSQLDGIVRLQQTGQLSCYAHSMDICKCRKANECRCNVFTYSDDVTIEKNDVYVLTVAANICHDPFPLFSELGLEDSIIYQENNTRERDPENISQKELIINLLHKWLEIKPTPISLRQLSTALCKASFHSINEKLYNLSINNVEIS